MTVPILPFTAFTGGSTGALDSFDGNLVTVGNAYARVFDGNTPKDYEYISTTDAENSPYLIRPDTNGTGKAWRQCGMISGNATLYVTSAGNDSTGNGTSFAPWATLGKALSWLADKTISSSATVTINIGAGTFVEPATLTIAGNQFRNVEITGAGSSSTTISWNAAGTDGLIITKNTSLGDLRNIKLYGDGANGYGFQVRSNSALYMSADIVSDNFNRGGFVTESSALNAANALICSNHNSHGLLVYYQSHAQLNGCTFTGNGDKGLYANFYSRVYAESSTSTNNVTGYQANFDSFIHAGTCTVSGNTTDYSPAKTTAADPTFSNQGSWIYG